MMGNEEWRPVIGYEGLYEVSSYGRVKSLERKATNGRRVAPKILRINYVTRSATVELSKDGVKTRISVSRLVAFAFGKACRLVVHKDKNIHNNRLDNLTCRNMYGQN